MSGFLKFEGIKLAIVILLVLLCGYAFTLSDFRLVNILYYPLLWPAFWIMTGLDRMFNDASITRPVSWWVVAVAGIMNILYFYILSCVLVFIKRQLIKN